jgi:hypothetical protein
MSSKINPAELESLEQGTLFEVPQPDKPEPRVYDFSPKISPEEVAERSLGHRIVMSSQAELEALNAIARENQNAGFREVGSMKGGTIRGGMIKRRAIAGQEDVPVDEIAPPTPEEMAEAESDLDIFLAGSTEQVHYLVKNIKMYFADSIRIKVRAEKDGDGPNARTTKIVAEDPLQQKELDRKFAVFFTKYAGTQNRDALVDRRKSLIKTLKSHGIEV